jgi:hypothetical protein
MMKPAEDKAFRDVADSLNRPMDGGILVQSTISPATVVIGGAAMCLVV